jgi:hypothetical protein
MKDLDTAFGSFVAVAARFDVPADAIVARARRRIHRRRAFVSICVVLVAGGTAAIVGVRGSHNSGQPPVSVQGPTVTRRPGEPVAFREELATIPYGTATSAPDETCQGGRAITSSGPGTADDQAILPDTKNTICYILGPTLLSETDVDSADAMVDPTTAAWIVNVHFENDDFVTKVAAPEVNRQIAIVLGDVVQSAPFINPGISGRDVTISGSFDEAGARNLAELISPSAVDVLPTTTAGSG